jgi:hypothetical protein
MASISAVTLTLYIAAAPAGTVFQNADDARAARDQVFENQYHDD